MKEQKKRLRKIKYEQPSKFIYNDYKPSYQMDNNQYRAVMSLIWLGFILGLCAVFHNALPLFLLFVYLMLIV